ncbi:hypothetical protein P8H27_00075 [Pseudomonas sp. sp1636]|uniref:hypothetical protein n=1 Tax=Pseudomonas sp. sp1636 TaxID=3036707 RepID=UPI0025A51203|nr:hypothetical protein [Pseudomonas sp. sp1636]MDM8347300.1 hypothetical protein [Pseudomonas sp. sp1636]
MDAQSFQRRLARLDRLTIERQSIVRLFLQIKVPRDGFAELIPDLKACPRHALRAVLSRLGGIVRRQGDAASNQRIGDSPWAEASMSA